MAAEKRFEQKIKQYFKTRGIWYVKYFANGYTKRGIPDILACVNGYFLGLELKAPRGRPSEVQLWTIRRINRSGGYACVLYPSGFNDFNMFIDQLMSGQKPKIKEVYK